MDLPTTPIELLADDEPAAYRVLHEHGCSPFVLTCDHAGNRIPKQLGTLGLRPADLERHIAWDIGAAGVTALLAERLDAIAILQTYSRLVIDCNRPPEVESSIARISEHTEIPGNLTLSEADKAMRIAEIFRPYHDRIAQELDRRQAAQLPTAVIAVHSFTPVFKGSARSWQAGVLYNRDSRMAKPMLALLRGEGLIVGDNEPYALGDASDYTIPVHGERRGLPHVEIEIRQDLIADAAGQKIWADRLAPLLRACWNEAQPDRLAK
jgi:predicted N-formylglutamate amidohydrolase